MEEDDLRTMIFDEKGIELPRDWDRDQILDWWDANADLSPEEIESPIGTPEDDQVGTEPISLPLSSADIEITSPKSPVGEPLITLSPRSQLNQALQGMQSFQQQRSPTSQAKPSVSRFQPITTYQPEISPISSTISGMKPLEKLTLGSIPAPDLYSRTNVPPTYQSRTARAQAASVPLKGIVSEGTYKLEPLPLETDLSTLNKIRSSLGSAMFVNPEATFQSRIPATEGRSKASSVSSSNVYTEPELNSMTVIKLKELLKANGLKIPKLKADMVKSLLDNQKAKQSEVKMETPEVEPEITSEVRVEPEIKSEVRVEPEITSEVRVEPEITSEVRVQPEITSEVRVQPEILRELEILREPEIQNFVPELYTEPELMALTVVKLKDLLKANGLKIPKLKADMVKSLLDKGVQKPTISQPQVQPQVQPQPPITPQVVSQITPQPIVSQPQKAEIIRPIISVSEPYTESELKAMFVPKLKELLKENGLKIPKLKADMIKSLLDNKVQKTIQTPVQQLQTPVSEPIPPTPISESISQLQIPISESIPVSESIPTPVSESIPIPISESIPVSESIPIPVSESIPIPVSESVFEPQIQPSELYTEPELMALTVVKLKDLLKVNGLKIPKLKAEMVKSLLDNKVRKPGQAPISEVKESKLEEEIKPTQTIIRPPSARRRPRPSSPIQSPSQQITSSQIRPLSPLTIPTSQISTPVQPSYQSMETNINQPISGEEFPEVRSKIKLPHMEAKQEVPIIVTSENIERVQLPVYETKLKPVPRREISPTEVKAETKLIQAYDPQQMALQSIKDIDPDKVSGEHSGKGSAAYTQDELRKIAKRLGLKATSKSKSELAERIREKLKEIGMIEK